MKTRFVPALVLFAVLVAACAPQAATESPAQPIVSVTSPPSVPTLNTSVEPTAGPTQDLAPTALPVATSRGPNLEATDPSTVSLASGQIQFVEFFRFT